MANTWFQWANYVDGVYDTAQFISDIRDLEPQGMEFRTTDDPVIDPTLLSEVKRFLRVNHTEDDNMIRGFIKSATKKIEGFIHRAIVTQEVTAYWTRAYEFIFLPRPPHISITSITEIDDDGTTNTIASGDYDIFGDQNYLLRFDSAIDNQLKVVYQAGYGDTSNELPQDLKDAVKWQTKLYYATSAEGEAVVVTENGLVEQAQVLASDFIYNYPGE